MGEAEMAEIAELIARVLRHRDDDAELAAVRDEVATLCSKFAPYPTWGDRSRPGSPPLGRRRSPTAA
jgi:hypothetical protein